MNQREIPFFNYMFLPPYYYYYNYVNVTEGCETNECDTSLQKRFQKTQVLIQEEKETKIEKIKQKKRSKDVDQDWSANRKLKKNSMIKQKKNLQVFNQKQGRNAISNILRSFLKFLNSKQAKQSLKKFCNQNNLSLGIQQILEWINNRGISYNNYVRLQSILKLIESDKLLKGRVLAMLYLVYSKKYMRNHFLTSLKLNENNKQCTLKKIREVECVISELYIFPKSQIDL